MTIPKLKQMAMKKEPMPTNNLEALEAVIASLMEDRREATVNGNFKLGISLLGSVDHVREFVKVAEKKNFQKEQQAEVEKMEQEVQRRISDYDMRMKEEEEKLKNQIARSRARLIKDLDRQVDEHEMLWQSEAQKRRYNHPSQELRTLRFQVKKMISCGRFRDAEQVLARADTLQKREEVANMEAMQLDYEKATVLLNQRIAYEVDVFDQNAEQQLANFRTKRDKNREVYQNQIKKVEQKAELTGDVDRCWNASQRQIIENQLFKKGGPRKFPATTRSFSKEVKQEEELVLTLPSLTPKRGIIRPIKNATYL